MCAILGKFEVLKPLKTSMKAEGAGCPKTWDN